MVKVTAPMMSMTASGKLGGAIVFTSWKGRPVVRTLVRPANPKSGGQTGVRRMFKYLAQIWQSIGAGNQATWEDYADQKVVSPFNAFMSRNQFRFRDFTPPTQADPAAETATPDTAPVISATLGVRSILIDIPGTSWAADWGYCIFRSLSSSVQPAFDNLAGMVVADAGSDVTWLDTPLVPDEYFYLARGFTVDGLWGADSNEVSETVV